MEIRLVGVLAPAKNDIQLGSFTQCDNVTGITLKNMLVLVKRMLPLLGLHVAEPQPTSCRRVVWELP